MTDSLLIALVIAAAILGAGVLVMLALKRRPDSREGEAERLVQELIRQQTELAGRIASISDAQTQTRQEITQTLNERLENVSQRMGQSLEDSAKKTAETLGNLTNRLTVIDEAQKNITELSSQVVGLQDILANRQARGAFGEVQLNDIVVNALPPSAYSFQTTLGNGSRVDCLIKLPNPPGSIGIDAKFPLDAYHALRNAQDEAGKTAAARQFRSDLQKHIAAISEKYIVPGETAESALMFLPSEAVYAELHANFPDVVQKSYQARVWIVSPTTLMATLNTVRAVLKDARMREQAGVIQKYVSLLLQDVTLLEKRVDKLGNHFRQAEGDINDIKTSTERIAKRSEKIQEVEMSEEEEAAIAQAKPTQDLLGSK